MPCDQTTGFDHVGVRPQPVLPAFLQEISGCRAKVPQTQRSVDLRRRCYLTLMGEMSYVARHFHNRNRADDLCEPDLTLVGGGTEKLQCHARPVLPRLYVAWKDRRSNSHLRKSLPAGRLQQLHRQRGHPPFFQRHQTIAHCRQDGRAAQFASLKRHSRVAISPGLPKTDKFKDNRLSRILQIDGTLLPQSLISKESGDERKTKLSSGSL